MMLELRQIQETCTLLNYKSLLEFLDYLTAEEKSLFGSSSHQHTSPSLKTVYHWCVQWSSLQVILIISLCHANPSEV